MMAASSMSTTPPMTILFAIWSAPRRERERRGGGGGGRKKGERAGAGAAPPRFPPRARLLSPFRGSTSPASCSSSRALSGSWRCSRPSRAPSPAPTRWSASACADPAGCSPQRPPSPSAPACPPRSCRRSAAGARWQRADAPAGRPRCPGHAEGGAQSGARAGRRGQRRPAKESGGRSFPRRADKGSERAEGAPSAQLRFLRPQATPNPGQDRPGVAALAAAGRSSRAPARAWGESR